MKRFLPRFWISMLIILVLSAVVPAFAVNELTAFQQAMQAEVERWGDVYTWSFEKKADFYNTYVYHGVGTRRGVPCNHVLQRDMIIEAAAQYLLTVTGATESELSGYIIDVDYWIEAFLDEDREHEYYTVLFVTQTAPHAFRSQYQLMLSPYSGEVTDFINLDDHRK